MGAWDEIFDLQDRVVSEIIQSLELEMDSSARMRIAAPETLRLEAYEQYVQGLKNYQALGKDSIEAARKHYEHAIELDPDYAVAYSGLGTGVRDEMDSPKRSRRFGSRLGVFGARP